MQVGERIRWLRKQRNITIGSLANKVGVTRQTISRYETGAIEDIPSSKLESLAAALEVSCAYLRGLTIESQCDSARFDIQQLKEALKSARNESERMEIEASIEILEKSYEDLLFVQQFQSSSPMGNVQKLHGFSIASKAHEWHSSKSVNLSMAIDSWLLFALKVMAADSHRSLNDEIEAALYDHVMDAIDAETEKENAGNIMTSD